MANRLSQAKPQPQRLRVPEGMTVKWVPREKPQQPPSSSKASDSSEIGPEERAQLHMQKVRLEQGRGPAEPGEGFVPTGGDNLTSEDRTYLEEQRARFPRDTTNADE